jgi:hypothetical protein
LIRGVTCEVHVHGKVRSRRSRSTCQCGGTNGVSAAPRADDLDSSSIRSAHCAQESQINFQNLRAFSRDLCGLNDARCGWIPTLISDPLSAAEAFNPHSTHRYFRTSGKETNLGSVQTRIMECPQSGHRTGSTAWGISLIANMRTEPTWLKIPPLVGEPRN